MPLALKGGRDDDSLASHLGKCRGMRLGVTTAMTGLIVVLAF